MRIGFYSLGHACWHAGYALTTALVAWAIAGPLYTSATQVGAIQFAILAPAFVILFFSSSLFDFRYGVRSLMIALLLLSGPWLFLLSFNLTSEVLELWFLALSIGVAEPIYLMLREALIASYGDRKTIIIDSLPIYEAVGRAIGYLIVIMFVRNGADFISINIIILFFISGIVFLICELLLQRKVSLKREFTGFVVKSKMIGFRDVISLNLRLVVFQFINGFVGVGAFVVIFPIVNREVTGGEAGALSAIFLINYVSVILLTSMFSIVKNRQIHASSMMICSLIVLIISLFMLIVGSDFSLIFVSSATWGCSAALAQIGGRRALHGVDSTILPQLSAIFHATFLGSAALGATFSGAFIQLFNTELYVFIVVVICGFAIIGIRSFKPVANY